MLNHAKLLFGFMPILLAGSLSDLHAADLKEFKPQPVPQWVRDTYLLTFTPPQNDADWDKAQADGVQVVYNYTVFPFDWYDGEKFYAISTKEPFSKARFEQPGDREKAQQKLQLAHSHGVHVIGSFPGYWEYKILADHPDWQVLATTDTKPADPFNAGWPPPVGCYMSPFGEFMIKKNIEMMKITGWDGQTIDGFFTPVLCHCSFCTKAYKEATGGEIPSKMDAKDPNFRRFLLWRHQQWEKYVVKWESAIKAINPDFAFAPWMVVPGRWWYWQFMPEAQGSELIPMMIDAPLYELFWDFPPDQCNNLLPSFVAALHSGICRDRAVWMLPYFRSQGQQNPVTPFVESEFRLFTVLTNGVVAPVGEFAMDELHPRKHYFDLIRDRRPWTKDARSIKWAAILESEKSRFFYGLPGKRPEFGGPVMGSGVDTIDLSTLPPGERRNPAQIEAAIGAWRACKEAHLPVDIISDLDLELGDRLDSYKVIFLPDAACMSERAMENLRAYVKRGGGIVATQATSLYDETGQKRDDFGLSDLFQAHCKAVEDHTGRWPLHINTVDLTLEKHPITIDPVIQGNFAAAGGVKWVDFIGWTTNVETPKNAKSQVIARYRIHKDGVPQPEERPFIVVSEMGKGRVVYFAGAIDQAYFVSPYQYERPMMVNAVRWAAGESVPPVEVKAPMIVQVAFYTQNDGKRTIVHLLNESNTTGGRALPEGNPSMREEILPISGIRVLIHDPEIQTARLQPENSPLVLEQVAGGFEVSVPSLSLHSMVVFDK